MTVKELTAELQKYDDDTKVLISYDGAEDYTDIAYVELSRVHERKFRSPLRKVYRETYAAFGDDITSILIS